MSQNKTFISSGNLKAHKLFAETNIWLAILKVALPGLLISLMSGVYIFADQLLLALLVPIDGVHDFFSVFGYMPEEIKADIITFNNDHNVNLQFLDTSDIIKSAISISAPLTMILNAMPLLAGIGAGIMFTQTIARNNHLKGREVWKTSFYSAAFIAIFSAVFFSSINEYILSAASGNSLDVRQYINGSTSENDLAVIAYFDQLRSLQIEWAGDYTTMLAIGSIFNVMVLYFSFMIRAEGRMSVVAIISISCNVLNILLDFIMIYLLKMGMAGGGTATLIGWAVNFVCYLGYIYYLSRKELTWMKFRYLKPDKNLHFSWTLLIPIIIIGSSVFLRNFSNSIANMMFTSSLNDVCNSINDKGQYFQTLSGAVMPINNLFFYAIFGLVDGVRPLAAYNHSQNGYNRVKKAYWITILCSVVYGLIVFGLMCSPFGSVLLSWFDIQQGQMLADASRYLLIQSLLITFASISIGGLMIFQSTNRMGMSVLVGIMQGLICYPIILYSLTTPVAISLNNELGEWILVATNSINGLVSSLIIFGLSTIFLYRYLGKRLINFKLFNPIKNKFENVRMKVDVNAPKMSYAQIQLEKPSSR